MPQLKRHVGMLEAVFYGLGIIIGAGVFVLIGPAAGLAGNSLWLAFLIAAVLAAMTGLSYAELASMFPRSAAEYVYVKHAYKNHFYAFILGWLIIFTGVVSISTVALGFTYYFDNLFNLGIEASKATVSLVAIAIIAITGLVNYRGLKETNWTNLAMSSVVIVGLALVIVLGLGKFGTVNYFDQPSGFSGVLAASGLIFFAFLGFEQIVNVAEETKRPRKVLPRAIMLSVVISTAIYILISISVVGLQNWSVLSGSNTPLADAASTVLGSIGGPIISIVALFATGSTILGMILVTSRMIWGMSRERALPKIFSGVHKRSTPAAAIFVVAVASAIFVFFGDIKQVASVTSLGAIIIFLNVNLALIWLRYKRPDMRRPFRTPLNIGKFPVLAAIGIGVSLFMIPRFDPSLLVVGVIVVSVGAVLFLIYKRRDMRLLRQFKELFGEIGREAK